MKHLILCSILLTTTVFAGKEGGNGGDVLVCRDENKKISSVELLDFYEARVKGRITGIDLGDASLSFTDKVHYAIDRIGKLDQRRAQKYRERFEVFFNEDQFGWVDKLVNIDDTGSLGIPENCEIEQIATQEEPSLPGDKRILIVKKYWDLLDSNNKAGLVLHELIYSEALDLRHAYLARPEGPIYLHSNSKKVRYFNSMISSVDFNQMGYEDYFSLVRDSDFLYISYGGIYFPTTYFGKEPGGNERENTLIVVDNETSNPIYYGSPDLQRIPEHAFVESYSTSTYLTPNTKSEVRIYRPDALIFDKNGKLNVAKVRYKGFPSFQVSEYFKIYFMGKGFIDFENGDLASTQNWAHGYGEIKINDFVAEVSFNEDAIWGRKAYLPIIIKDKNGLPDFRPLGRYFYRIYLPNYINREAKLSFHRMITNPKPVKTAYKSYYLSRFMNLHFDQETKEPRACIYGSRTEEDGVGPIEEAQFLKIPVQKGFNMLCASFQDLWDLKPKQLRPFEEQFQMISTKKTNEEMEEILMDKCEGKIKKFHSEKYLSCQYYGCSAIKWKSPTRECTVYIKGKGSEDWPHLQ